MANTSQTGFAAELFTAAELTKLGHLVTITFGNEKAIDLLVAKADDATIVRSVDVKGLAKPADWPMNGYLKGTKHPGSEILLIEEQGATLKQEDREAEGTLRITQEWSPMGLFWELTGANVGAFAFGEVELNSKSFKASGRIFCMGQHRLSGYV